MKKMKKFLGIMLAMVMAVTMLAGCGGKAEDKSEKPKSDKNKAKDNKPKEEQKG